MIITRKVDSHSFSRLGKRVGSHRVSETEKGKRKWFVRKQAVAATLNSSRGKHNG